MRFKNSNSTYNKKTYPGKLVPQNRNGLVVIAIVLLVAVALVGAASAYTVTLPETDNMIYSGWYSDDNWATSVEIESGVSYVPQAAKVKVQAVTTGAAKVIRSYGWTVTDADNGSVYVAGENNTAEFTMPDSDVTVEAEEEDQLPAGYTELEYISGDGNSYIQTPNKPTMDSVYYSKWDISKDVSGQTAIYGTGGAEALSAWCDGPYNWRFGGELVIITISRGLKYIKQSKYGVTINDKTTTYHRTGSYKSNVKPVRLFDNQGEWGLLVGKCYYFVVSEKGTTVCDMIPCIRKSDNAVGMYDTVEGKFYGNNSSGSFTPGYFKVTYGGNGGSGTKSENVDDLNNMVTIDDGAGMVRTGYIFAGWNTKADGTGVTYEVGESYYMASNLTLYAKWTPITYAVHYDANGGTGTMDKQDFTYDEEQNLSTNMFTNSGYTFAGWATSVEGEVVYTDGQSVSNLASTQGAEVTLYAKWTEALKYYVYIPSGVTLQSTPVEGTYKIKILTQGPADGKSVVLRYSSSAHAEGSTKYVVLSGDSSEKMSYTVTLPNSGDDIQPGTVIVSLPASSEAGTELPVVLTYSGVNSTGKKAGSYSDTLTFTVSVGIPVESVTVSGDTTTVDVGSAITLTANVLPDTATDKTVTWSSSNTSVASVSDTGVVTGVAAGTAVIKATANDGTCISGSCTVTVTAPVQD